MKHQLILASKSPRRKELLSWLKIPFEIIVSDVDEDISPRSPEVMAMDIAHLKGEDIFSKLNFSKYSNPVVVAADTVVALDNRLYAKPKDIDDARRILKELSGKTHKVVTGVYIKKMNTQEELFSVTSYVEFRDIPDDILETYLETGESLDKAGAYGIQGAGLMFIGKLEGSYSNVVGFPLSDFVERLRKYLGVEPHKKIQNYFI